MSEDEKETTISETPEKKVRKPRVKAEPLLNCYLKNPYIYEIGVDEVGRGPLFGRVYTAAVILPKDDTFDHSKMKDSKKFHSKQKIQEVAEYIKENAIAWSVAYEDEKTIDEINILQATQKCMHKCIKEVLTDTSKQPEFIQLLIDGNYFNSYTSYNTSSKKFDSLNHVCVEGGDNKYSCIAAASILAKVARDAYIEELCAENPELSERYNIDSNKGYGAKKHLDGIKEHGITKWHRKTFGICKVSKMAAPYQIELKIET
jgi:ribonuclease HII